MKAENEVVEKEKVDNIEDPIKEDTPIEDTRKRFQWIKGEFSGNVEIFKDTINEKNFEWMIFESGNRINTAVMSEFMMEVGIGQELDINESLNQSNELGAKEVPPVKNPLKILLEKQKSFDKVSFQVNFTMDLPKPELFEIFYETFGDEFKEVITEHILSKYDIETISKEITDNINKELDRRFAILKDINSKI